MFMLMHDSLHADHKTAKQLLEQNAVTDELLCFYKKTISCVGFYLFNDCILAYVETCIVSVALVILNQNLISQI
jgi:hypothetical protein